MIIWIKKNQYTLFTSLIFLFFLGLLLITAIKPILSTDSFWHLKMGLDLIEKGLSPFLDHYSYTFSEQPITDVPYIFQTILALFVSTFGLLTGYQLLRFFAFGLLLFTLYKFFKYINSPWPVILLVLPFIVFFAQMRIFVRPELFDYSLIILALILYIKAKESFSNKNLSYITLLLLFWSNYHVALLGYIIFFGLFLDKAIEIIRNQDESLSWQRWLVWGIIVFLVGFINPEFKHCFFAILNFSSEWNNQILEYTPSYKTDNYQRLFVFWLVSIYLILALLKQKQYGFAFICALFAFKSWQMVNLITVYGIITFSLLAYSLTKVDFPQFFVHIKKSIKQLILFFYFTAVVLGMFMAISSSQSSVFTKKFPESTVMYLKTTYPQGGNIFHPYDMGGYLAYTLAPTFKTYIDGRSNILYPIEFTIETFDIFKNISSSLLSEKIDQYNIEYAIMPLDRKMFLLMHRTKKMGIDFVGNEFILFSTQQNNFPISTSLLLFPMCWDNKYQDALSSEIIKGEQILSRDSTLRPVLTSLDKINHSDNIKAFFNSLDVKQASNEHMRLLAYIALKSGSNVRAFKLFEKVLSDAEYLDLLMMVYAAINAKEYTEAEKVLFLTSEVWPNLMKQNPTINEKSLIITLYEKLKKSHTLQGNSEEYFTRLKHELEQQNFSNSLPLPNIIPQGYCNELFPEHSQTQ